jgi:hypothetical protein
MVFLAVIALIALLVATVSVVDSHRKPDYRQFHAEDRVIPFQTSGASSFETHTTRAQAIDDTIRWAQEHGYHLEYVDDNENRAVFSHDSGIGALHYGHWLIVECEMSRASGTIVSVDVHSRSLQPSFTLAYLRDEVLRELRKYLRPNSIVSFSWKRA